ncbi:MAG: TVP38/TMEM64 family protein [Planctomycetota bacterium]
MDRDDSRTNRIVRTDGKSGLTARRKRRAWVGWLAVGATIAGVLVSLRGLPMETLVSALTGWIDGLGSWGPVVFAAAYVLASLLFVPGAALTLAAGAVFGIVGGTVTVSFASTIASACAFLIARYIARGAVARRADSAPKFGAIDRAVGEGGWKIVALLRLSPAVPFTLLNYLLGLTAIGFWPSTLASWISMLPGTLLYVYLGHVGKVGLEAASRGEAARSPAQLVLLIVGLLATLGVTVYTTRIARRALRGVVEDGASVPPFGVKEEAMAHPAMPVGGARAACRCARALGR